MGVLVEVVGVEQEVILASFLIAVDVIQTFSDAVRTRFCQVSVLNIHLTALTLENYRYHIFPNFGRKIIFW